MTLPSGQVMFIKLINGDMLVATVNEFQDEDTQFYGFNLDYPFTFMMEVSPGEENARFKFEEYIPENICDVTSMQIHGANVIFMTPVKEEFKKFYSNMIEEFNKQRKLRAEARRLLDKLVDSKDMFEEEENEGETLPLPLDTADGKIVSILTRKSKPKLH